MSDVSSELLLPKEVFIFDTTMRDGEQTVGVSFSVEEKVELARRLNALGVPQIQIAEAGNPRGRKEAETLCRLGLATKWEVMTGAGSKEWRSHVDAALACGADILHTNIATSTYMRNMQGDIPESEVIKRLDEVVTYMRKGGAKIVKVALMDAPPDRRDLLAGSDSASRENRGGPHHDSRYHRYIHSRGLLLPCP